MSYSSTGLQRTKTTGGALQLGFRIDGSHELFGGGGGGGGYRARG